MVVSIWSAMVSRFCVKLTFKRWFLIIVQVTMKHNPFEATYESTYHHVLHWSLNCSVKRTWTGFAFSTNESAWSAMVTGSLSPVGSGLSPNYNMHACMIVLFETGAWDLYCELGQRRGCEALLPLFLSAFMPPMLRGVMWSLVCSGSLHTRDWEPVTITFQAFSLVEKAEPVQVRCFTLRLRDQRSMGMQRWM